jgi:hypothetical protein
MDVEIKRHLIGFLAFMVFTPLAYAALNHLMQLVLR